MNIFLVFMEYNMIKNLIEKDIKAKRNQVRSMTENELKLIILSKGNNPLKEYAQKELKRRGIY